ncbi:hypothetical protein GUITHDRAFT_119251 [Guillardia theta CCMP2712]|uniref:Uncharacterized protein n=1 Tax=Guillardia theta (strain CCMP2712) TaxID=905079 RepID=L1IEA3_GUITC|nr:hypothetical protein GUITHDRAFT_119251 [Guillardia theta CCMP2712]EKX34601.1 hypothetical protein GUITHDRAFT_119251 [Guillardia theta CCMP2712]|eukprot:XP_005821581.1 hypothetical protein GUITHDRAFT_119251 [Guillardia theta CCMP2712]
MVVGEAEGGQARDSGEEAIGEAAAAMVALLVLRRDECNHQHTETLLINLRLLLDFAGTSSCHRAHVLSQQVPIKKVHLGPRGTAIDLLCGLLGISNEGYVPPSFRDDVISAILFLTEEQPHILWAALKRRKYSALRILLQDPNRKSIGKAAPSVSRLSSLGSTSVKSPRTDASRTNFWATEGDNTQTDRDEKCLALILRVVKVSSYAMQMGSEAVVNEVNLFTPAGLIQFLSTPADSVAEMCLEVLLRIFAARGQAMEQFLLLPSNFAMLIDILDMSLPPVMRNLSLDNASSMNRRFMKKKSTNSIASNLRESSVSSLRSDVPKLNLQLRVPSAQTTRLACAIVARLCSIHETMTCKTSEEVQSAPIAHYLDALHRPGFLRSLVYHAVAGTEAKKAAMRSLANVSSRSSTHPSLVRVMEEENEAMFRFVEQKLRSPLKDEDTEFITCLIGNLTSSIEGFQAIQKRPALVDLLHELMRAPTPPPMESADSLEVEKQENLRGLGMLRPTFVDALPSSNLAPGFDDGQSRSPPISVHGSVTQRFWEAASVPNAHEAWKLAHRRVQPTQGFSGYPTITAGQRSLGIYGTWKAREHSGRALANIMKQQLGTRTWKPTALC